MDRAITGEELEKFKEDFEKDRANLVAMNAVVENGVAASAKNYETERALPQEFSVSLKHGEITNQKKSGRCWMFAALNVLRTEVMKKTGMENFELSENYTAFYDKLEKANYFLENILATLDEPTDGRLISFLLQNPMNDGGQWDMLCSVVEKYGVVPKYAMPESAASSDTKEICAYVTEKLREDACLLRKAHAEGKSTGKLRAMKEEMLETVYGMFCIAFGEPTKRFTFEYRDGDRCVM